MKTMLLGKKHSLNKNELERIPYFNDQNENGFREDRPILIEERDFPYNPERINDIFQGWSDAKGEFGWSGDTTIEDGPRRRWNAAEQMYPAGRQALTSGVDAGVTLRRFGVQHRWRGRLPGRCHCKEHPCSRMWLLLGFACAYGEEGE